MNSFTCMNGCETDKLIKGRCKKCYMREYNRIYVGRPARPKSRGMTLSMDAQLSATTAELPTDQLKVRRYRFRDASMSFEEIMFVSSAVLRSAVSVGSWLTTEQRADLVRRIMPFEPAEETNRGIAGGMS